MSPVESTSPHLARFLSGSGGYPAPYREMAGATVAVALGATVGVPAGFVLNPTIGVMVLAACGASAVFLGFRAERNLPVGARRHRAAAKVRERLRTMMTLKTLHRTLDADLLTLLDEGCHQYRLARARAAKVRHELTAQADAAAVATMDDLLLEIGLNLPQKAMPRTFGDAMADGFAVRPASPIGAGLGRFFGATPPPPTDYDALRRARPHVQALAELAAELERTLPALVGTMDLPGGEPPIAQTLAALRDHRESREQLERDLRLGG